MTRETNHERFARVFAAFRGSEFGARGLQAGVEITELLQDHVARNLRRNATLLLRELPQLRFGLLQFLLVALGLFFEEVHLTGQPVHCNVLFDVCVTQALQNLRREGRIVAGVSNLD